MAITSPNSGVAKAIDKKVGILWHANVGEVDLADITGDADLSTLGFVDAGAISTDGVTVASNSSDPTVYEDWNRNSIDSEDATSSPTITFSVLEASSENAARLIYADSAITADESGNVTEIRGTDSPGNKVLVLDYRIKEKRVREVYSNASFSGRGDRSLANDSLWSQEVTYSLLVGEDGLDQRILYRPAPQA